MTFQTFSFDNNPSGGKDPQDGVQTTSTVTLQAGEVVRVRAAPIVGGPVAAWFNISRNGLTTTEPIDDLKLFYGSAINGDVVSVSVQMGNTATVVQGALEAMAG